MTMRGEKRGRLGRHRGWLLAFVLLGVGFGVIGVGTQAAPPPILLVTSSASANPFGPYLGEILRAEGLNQFSVKDLAVVTPTDLASASVVVLAETPLTGGQATLLSNFVAGGGRLVAMRPDDQIASVLGLTPTGTSLDNGYFAVNYATAFADGFPTATLPFHGSALNYTPGVGSSVLATLYSTSTVPTAYPAVIRSGTTVTWAYDLARAVVYTRQGRPENASDRDGQPPYRTTDLFYNAVDRDKVNIPYADVQMRMFARTISELLADAIPLPRLWHLPGTNRTLVVLTGDAHANPQSYYDSEIASIEARGGKISLYLSGGGDPSAAAVQAWRANGHEVGMHPAGFQFGRSLDAAFLSAQGYFAGVGIDPPSTTYRNHQLEWQGWVDAAKVAAARGMGLDTSFYTWGPTVTYPDGHQAHGYINGSGQPMRFIDEAGAIVPVYQQVTSLIDEALVIGDFSEHLTPTQATDVSRQLIDSSQAGDYAAITTQFHIDYYNYGEVRPWAEGTMDYAQSLGIPMWTAERWLNHTIARTQTTMTGFSWAAGPRQLSFTVGVPSGSEPQTVALPGSFGGFGITGVSVDGTPATAVAQVITGRAASFVSVAPGTHAVVATYTTPIPPPQHVPIAVADAASAQEAQTTIIPVLANDSDADGDPLTVSIAPHSGASLIVNGDQTISYLANPGTCGVDTFSYTIDDGRGGTATATVTVAVTCVNGQVTHTTVADFGAACAVPTNTIVTLVGNGELRLAGTQGDEYAQPTLDPANWVAGTWSGGGYAPAPVGGVLSLSNAAGAYVRSVSTLPLTTLESSARFTGLPWEHIGWGSLNFGAGYAIFSTYNTTTNLFVRTSQDGSTEQQTNLGPIPSGFHTYRIERQVLSPTSNMVSYYVDGVLRGQHTVGALAPMHVYQSHSGGTAQTLDIDKLWVYPPYQGAGTYQSCTLDIGHTLSRWTTAEWSAATAPGATLRLRTRTSADGTGWSGWSAPLTASGQDVTSPAGRYLQYRAEFTSTDPSQGVVLNSVTLRYVDNNIPPQRSPIAISDAASTTEGSPVTIQVLANDSDPDNDPIGVLSATPGAQGSVAINVDQSITYTPGPGACGTDSFSYTIGDGRGGTASAAVSVNIACVTGSVTQATFGDFGPACSVATNAVVSRAGDGEVRLAGVQGDEFGDTALDLALWTAGTWAGGAYAPTPGGGILSVSDANGAFVRSATSLAVTTLESSARFASLPWQHLGWGSLDFSGGYAMFSTYNTSTNLFARTNSGGGELQTNLGPIPAGFHSYRIDKQTAGPGSDTVRYFVDGLLVAEHSVGTVSPMHVYLSHNGGTAASLDVERLWVYPSYRGAGSFQSCTMDGGAAPFSWTKANWNATVPPGTALQVSTRTSADGLTWSPWSLPLAASGQDILSPPGRYLQYLLDMTTTDSTVSPVVDSVVMGIHLDAVDAAPPVISGIAVSGISGAGATVSWTTDEPSTSVVQFGPTRAYGFETASPALVTSHSVVLTGLTGGVAYDFRVISVDGAGNETDSSNGSFVTPLPSISISDASVTEGNAGSVSASFVVSLSAPSNSTVTVAYATASGTAVAPADFTSGSGTLTFEAGVTSLPVIVSVAGETLFEGAEAFVVNLSVPAGAAILDGQGVGTIQNDDVAPTVSISDASTAEGNSLTKNLPFTVTLSAASGLATTVTYSTANGTATAGSDYTGVPPTVLTIPAGTVSVALNVVIAGDTATEANEVFVVDLSSPVNATIIDSQGAGTILNDDAPSVTIGDVSVTEGNTGTVNATFTVTLSQPTTQTVTVNYATASGTASSASDYSSRSGTLTFAGTTTQTVSVPVNGDAQVEANETFVLNLNGASNATLADAQGVATILNDDLPTLSINDVTVTEGNSGSLNATFTVTLSAAVSQTVTVNYATANGTATAGSDYTAIPSTGLSFAPGQVTRTFTVAVTGDTAPEAVEDYLVNLSGAANATIADPQGVGTISDNDGTMTVTSPTTSSIWVIGSAQTITWTNNLGVGATVTLELSRNGGSSWTALGTGTNATATGGSFAWTVTGPTTASAVVRATWTTNGNVTNTSSGSFDIVNGTLTVTTPPSGATWAIGSTQTIAWTNDFGTGATVNLELSRNGGLTWTAIGTGTNSSPTAGTFAWTVTGATTTTARVRATQVANPSVTDTNPGNFTIANPTITVTSPNGGNTWTVGSNQTITWSSNVPTTDNVRIELSLNGGATYPTVVLASTPNDGTQTVSVQSAWRTTQARIRVVWLTNTAVTDASNANFTIP